MTNRRSPKSRSTSGTSGPHACRFAYCAAPRGGRCACGPAKPVPRPWLVGKIPHACRFAYCAAPRGGRCACGPAKPAPRPWLVGKSPHACRFAYCAAPRGGRCACGPAKPVPRPWLVGKNPHACRFAYCAAPPRGAAAPAARHSRFRGPGWWGKAPKLVASRTALHPEWGRCACGPAKPAPRPWLAWAFLKILL